MLQGSEGKVGMVLLWVGGAMATIMVLAIILLGLSGWTVINVAAVVLFTVLGVLATREGI